MPLEAGLDWFEQGHPGAQIEETALVHVPIFLYKYLYRGQTYTAVVDAASGGVHGQPLPGQGRDALPFGRRGGGFDLTCAWRRSR